MRLPKPPESALKSPDGIPVVPAIQVAILLAFKSGDAKGDFGVTITPVLPSGKKLPRSESIPMTLLGGGQGVNIRSSLLIPIEEEGQLWFEVRVDGKLVTRMPLQVEFLTSPPDTQAPESSPGTKKET